MNYIQRSTVLFAFVVVVTAITASLSGIAANEKPALEHGAAEMSETAVAIFGGGCFWCMERPFDELDGVVDTTSGYIGGANDKPSYKQVSAGNSGHVEVVQVRYDPTQISYDALLDVYWKNVDPLTPNAQFCDSGDQYRSAIFTRGDAQWIAASQSKQDLENSGRFEQEIVTTIENADGVTFWPAEEYHQDYYLKNPIRYKFYRTSCGRDARLKELWSDAA